MKISTGRERRVKQTEPLVQPHREGGLQYWRGERHENVSRDERSGADRRVASYRVAVDNIYSFPCGDGTCTEPHPKRDLILALRKRPDAVVEAAKALLGVGIVTCDSAGCEVVPGSCRQCKAVAALAAALREHEGKR